MFTELYNHPSRYLAYPPNVTGGVNTCTYLKETDLMCTPALVLGPERDRYLWFADFIL